MNVSALHHCGALIHTTSDPVTVTLQAPVVVAHRAGGRIAVTERSLTR